MQQISYILQMEQPFPPRAHAAPSGNVLSCVCVYVCTYVYMLCVHVCTICSLSSHPVSVACEFLPVLHNSCLCCTSANKHGVTEQCSED